MSGTPERKPFTGRHAAIILVAFFGVVIGVNMVMASFALSTFGGTVVDNSYVASQHYNEWLARAEAQDRLGWEESVAVDESLLHARGDPRGGRAAPRVERHCDTSPPARSGACASDGFCTRC